MAFVHPQLRTLSDHSQAAPLTASQVARAYNFPTGVSGRGYTAGIIELGGGYSFSQLQHYFTEVGLSVPSVTDVSVDGAANTPGDPNGADGEVQLDLIVAASVAPAAAYRVYFAQNTSPSFHNALARAVQECNGVSISWGGPENSWDSADMQQFADVIKSARARGVPVFVAAGDSGADDGSNTLQVDFPASAPDSVACGGTRLALTPQGDRGSESVWDDNPASSATGGGASRQFPGRQVPDVAGNADPATGYQISIDGSPAVVGGTSAVAPLFLGLHALLWEANGAKNFDFMNVITASPAVCFDVTQGGNGGFSASPGRDECSGYGVPDGERMLMALKNEAGQAPPDPAPTPPPSPAPPVVPAPPTPPSEPAPTPGGPTTLVGTFIGTFVGAFIPVCGGES